MTEELHRRYGKVCFSASQHPLQNLANNKITVIGQKGDDAKVMCQEQAAWTSQPGLWKMIFFPLQLWEKREEIPGWQWWESTHVLVPFLNPGTNLSVETCLQFFLFFLIQQWHQLSTGCTGNLSDLKQIFYVHKFYVLGKVSHDRNVMTQGGIHPEWWDLGRGTRVVCVIVSTKSVSACQPPLVFKQKPGQEHYGQSQVYRQLAGKTQQHSVHFICCSTLGFFFPWTYKHTNTWCVCDVGVAALPPGVCERPGSSATCTFAAYSSTFNLMRPCTAWFVYSKIHVVADESSVSLEIT